MFELMAIIIIGVSLGLFHLIGLIVSAIVWMLTLSKHWIYNPKWINDLWYEASKEAFKK